MKVLWFSLTPSLYDEENRGSWVAALETIIRERCTDIELGIAFEYNDKKKRVVKGGVTYYPIRKFKNKWDFYKSKFDFNYEWELLEPSLKKIVADFNPDIIHCFGSEWPYGKVVAFTKVPVVIHMQGFLNVYRTSRNQVFDRYDYYRYFHYNLFKVIHYSITWSHKRSEAEKRREREIMAQNKYFMGRTEWDKNIVKHYNPTAKYYHCEEAIREAIYNSPIRWHFQKRKKMRIVTISSASPLKGNGLILETAKILKEEMNFDFEWRVAGNKNSFKLIESKVGIRKEDVNITLLGLIDADTIISELAEADVYVHTAIIDNSPNSLCEAQLIGCPIISTNVGGIPQLIDDGCSGILFPYNEPHTLAFLLMDIFGNQEKMEYLSKNEINISHMRHDPQKIAARLKNIYSNIISQSGE